jgi:hypothetical protein
LLMRCTTMRAKNALPLMNAKIGRLFINKFLQVPRHFIAVLKTHLEIQLYDIARTKLTMITYAHRYVHM